MLINGIEHTIAPSANLSCADLRDADLRGANLRSANLYSANLRGADLRGADLYSADLNGANLRDANLYSANLSCADLRSADLRGANLRCANLSGANLRDANLSCANLSGANLRDANLSCANLSGAKNISSIVVAQTTIAAEGDLIGYKKLNSNVICKLLIPALAKRSNATGRKCKAEFAIVLEGEGTSQHDDFFHYRVGETVRPREPFCENRWEECASGIHFFLTRAEAEAY